MTREEFMKHAADAAYLGDTSALRVYVGEVFDEVAFMERQRIVAWIRAKHALGSLDCSWSLMALESLRVVADEIERGEHGE